MTTTQITHGPIEAQNGMLDYEQAGPLASEPATLSGKGFHSQVDLASLADQFGFVVAESILPELDVPDKEAAIRTMVGSLAESGAIPESEQESITTAIINRERLGSTGIGRGIAIPHTRHDCVNRVVATMAYSREGIDFDSLDGQPVHLLLLLVSPAASPGDHLRALETVSRCLANRQDRVWRTDLRHAGDDPK